MAAGTRRRGFGFRQTGQLLESRIRSAGESRGFAVSKLLTHWDEVAGPDLASKVRPVTVNYGRKGFGATLTVLTSGAFAPLLEMQKERLREKVNACYGYNAISRIKITQTAPTGFAEPGAAFTPTPVKPDGPPAPAPVTDAARTAAGAVQDPGLRDALARLGSNILNSKHSS